MDPNKPPTSKLVHIQDRPPVEQKWSYGPPRNIGERLTKCKHPYPATNCGCNVMYSMENNKTTSSRHDNGFFDAFLQAYNNHGIIVLSPDDVWLVICMHLSKYIDKNAEELRDIFVSHAGKKKLNVVTWNERDESQWGEFLEKIKVAIRSNTKEGITDLLQCNFSSTGPVEHIISTVVIMDSFKKYFDYGRCIPMCGITDVNFLGTLDDWEQLLTKLIDLKGRIEKTEWSDYTDRIQYIINQFINTYKGKVDVKFWNKVMDVKYARLGSGSTTYISGWILDFFGLKKTVESDDIPSYGFDVPVEIVNKITGIKKMVSLVGGFTGINVENNMYRPTLGMIVYHDGNTEKIETN